MSPKNYSMDDSWVVFIPKGQTEAIKIFLEPHKANIVRKWFNKWKRSDTRGSRRRNKRSASRRR